MNKEEKSAKPDSKFKQFINNRLVPSFGKVATQRHLLAIRNGIISALPFVLVGSIFTIINSFPIGGVDSKYQYISQILPQELSVTFDYINRFTFGLLALYVSVGIGAELARFYRLSSTQGASMGAFGYIIWMTITSVKFAPLTQAQIDGLGLEGEQLGLINELNGQLALFSGGLWINIKNMGGSSVFVAMIASTATIEMYRACVKYRITIRMPKQVPKAVSDSFLVLVPILFMSLIYGAMHFTFGFDLATFLIDALQPMGTFITQNVWGAAVIAFLITFLWWFGIHGSSLVQSITRPFWLIALEENANAIGTPDGPQNTFVEPFFQWFVQFGGSGNTLGLVILGATLSKSIQVKTISRVGLVPSIFNVNEPITFGLPVILNPYMWIPFVLGPIATVFCGWGLQSWLGFDWVAMSPWTLPFPIGAYLAAGASWQASLSTVLVFFVSTLIWVPFFKAYDNHMVKQENLELIK